LDVSGWSLPAALSHYVCANCGYVEIYIEEATKLREIAEKWPKVGEAQS
jgi:hypothetical protein